MRGYFLMMVALLGVALAQGGLLRDDSGGPVVALQRVADATLPVYATHAGDGSGRLFVVELEGLIRVWHEGNWQAQPFIDLRSRIQALYGEQGLYSVAFHPDFADNGRFFVSYAQRGSGHLIVAEHRAEAGGMWADPDAFELILLDVEPFEPFHYGGQLAFGPDGYLYVGIGDTIGSGDHELLRRQVPPAAQDLRSWHGTVLRLDVDRGLPYAIPPDNPFVADPEARPEIYAYGFRNPYKFSFDRESGALYLADVGWSSWEEVNLIRAGGNYGWPAKEGPQCARFPDDGALVVANCETAADYLDPVAYYGHVPRDPRGGRAIIGGYVYRGSSLPELLGRYLFGDFVSGRIWALHEVAPELWLMQELLDTDLAIVSFAEDEAGELYVLDLRGGIYRLGP